MSEKKSLTRPTFWKLGLSERRIILLIGDIFASILGLFIALYIWGSADKWLGFSLEFLRERPPTWFFILPLFWLFLLLDLYDPNKSRNFKATMNGITFAVITGLLIYLIVYFTSSPESLPRRGVASFIIASALLTLFWRFVYIRIFTTSRFMQRVLVVGAGRSGTRIMEVINSINPKPYHLIGVIDDDINKTGSEIQGIEVLGTSESLPAIVQEQHISDIIVAVTGEMKGSTFQTILDLQEKGVEILRMPVVYEDLLGRVPIELLESDWIIRSFVDSSRKSGFLKLIKRSIDLIGGLLGTLIFIILLPIITIAILIEDGRPILYYQTRTGSGSQLFMIIKFRTMIKDAEPDGKPQWAQEKDSRSTRVGRILRRMHIDELPQFLNVLRGEMSLVGPRAERPELIKIFMEHVPFYRARLLVKPGITGWAQVNFGYAQSVEETIKKLEFDLYYIKHQSILFDLRILLRTPPHMLGLFGDRRGMLS